MQARAAHTSAQAVAQVQTVFGADLLGQLTRDTPSQNVCFSPASISTILTLTMSGAGGKTHVDMARTLHLSLLTAHDVNAGSKRLMQSENVSASSGVTLSVANALWANNGVSFAPTFQSGARDNYSALTQTLDFSSPSAAETINAWVGKNTRGHITQIVSAEDINPSVDIVLTNAVFFQGKWQSPFIKSDTYNAPFTLANGTKKTVPMMTQDDNFAYQENAQFQAVRLHYGSGRFVLDVFLPRGPLKAFLPLVTTANLKKWNSGFQFEDVELFLPRWKMQYEAELSTPLKALGMESAFTKSADFAPMGLPGDCIGAVIHKATFDVDEQGTVATAATGVIVMPTSARLTPILPKVFRVDHPFLFVVRDTQTGSLLFVGVVYDPKG